MVSGYPNNLMLPCGYHTVESSVVDIKLDGKSLKDIINEMNSQMNRIIQDLINFRETYEANVKVTNDNFVMLNNAIKVVRDINQSQISSTDEEGEVEKVTPKLTVEIPPETTDEIKVEQKLQIYESVKTFEDNILINEMFFLKDEGGYYTVDKWDNKWDRQGLRYKCNTCNGLEECCHIDLVKQHINLVRKEYLVLDC